MAGKSQTGRQASSEACVGALCARQVQELATCELFHPTLRCFRALP